MEKKEIRIDDIFTVNENEKFQELGKMLDREDFPNDQNLEVQQAYVALRNMEASLSKKRRVIDDLRASLEKACPEI